MLLSWQFWLRNKSRRFWIWIRFDIDFILAVSLNVCTLIMDRFWCRCSVIWFRLDNEFISAVALTDCTLTWDLDMVMSGMLWSWNWNWDRHRLRFCRVLLNILEVDYQTEYSANNREKNLFKC